jgi:hypothetical protein
LIEALGRIPIHKDERLRRRRALGLWDDGGLTPPAVTVPAATLCFPYKIAVWREQRAPPAEAIHIRTDGFLDSGAERSVIGFGLISSYLIEDTLRRVSGQSLRTAGQLIPLSHSGDAAICLG